MAERPDERLLLRADRVRRVPEGARVWHARDEYVPGVVVGVTLDGRIMVRWVGGRECAHGADRLLLDLSAPVDGERVDLLPTALGWLGWRCARWPPPDGVGMFGGMQSRDWLDIGSRSSCWQVPDDLYLSDLSDTDAARAVVVAALGVARG